MGGELKLNQKSYYFFCRPSLFWILNGYKKNLMKKNQFFIKKLKLRLRFELEIPMERSKSEIEIFKFGLLIQKNLEKLKIESAFLFLIF